MSVFVPLTYSQWPAYELIDFGEGKRLERWGEKLLIRPDKEAFGRPGAPESEWRLAAAEFSEPRRGKGKWQRHAPPAELEPWTISYEALQFELKLTPFKHVGLFPEQLSQWLWLRDAIRKELAVRTEPIRVLNLFAYTGAASLFCAQAGAEVVHIESSRSTVSWARRNQELSSLASAPIRWIPEDAATFVRRELERGNTYDIIIMDPPIYGLGPRGERWQFARHITELLQNCHAILSPEPLALILNAYASHRSARTWSLSLAELMGDLGGHVSVDSLGIQATHRKQLLSTGLSVSWRSDRLA